MASSGKSPAPPWMIRAGIMKKENCREGKFVQFRRAGGGITYELPPKFKGTGLKAGCQD